MATIKSTEEKAKAYDEAIKRLEDIKTGKCQKTFMFTEGLFDYIFPELKESEVERTRKEILDYIINGSESLYDVQQYGKERFEKWIAWLEKQGDHANFRNKIQIGDKVTRNEDGVLVNLSQLKRVAKKDEKQGEQKPAEWSEDDQSNFNELSSFILETYRAEDASGLITWLKSLKDRVQPQPKQEWSEEYEKRIKNIEESLLAYKIIVMDNDMELANYIEKDIEWLKSLKDRYTWKPSDEQMDALHYVTNFDYGGHKATLVSLYEQLKKLKG